MYGRKHARPSGPRQNDGGFNSSYVRELPDGTTIHSQTERVGYGFTRYQIVSPSPEGIEAAIASIRRSHPEMPYGGYFTWPPDRKYVNSDRLMDEQPQFFTAPGFADVVLVTGSHSNTSD